MTTSYYVPAIQGFASPIGLNEKVFNSAMHSPRTITLGNQSEAILRDMNSNHTAVMLSSKKGQMFAQTALPPLMPSDLQLSPSRPIRITRRKTSDLTARYSTEDLLSASPTELKHMYDEATWRMYHLIQTARMEKQAVRVATAPLAANWPTATSEASYIYDDSYFLGPPTPGCQSGMNMRVVSPQEEDSELDDALEEGVFELDDF